MHRKKPRAAVLLTLLALLPLQRAEAAKLHDLRREDKHYFAEPYKQALLQLGARATKASIHARMLELDRGIGLVKNSEQMWKGVRTYSYEQTYQGIPIYKRSISVMEDQAGNILAVAGYSIAGLDQDIPVTSAHVSPEAALRLAESDWSMALQPLATFDHEAVTKIVFIDKHDVGHLAYVVTFQAFEMNNPEPMVPSVIVDAFSGKILEKSNILMHAQATGPGGSGVVQVLLGLAEGAVPVHQPGDFGADVAVGDGLGGMVSGNRLRAGAAPPAR